MRKVDLTNRDFFHDDPDDPAGFRASIIRPGKDFGAKRTGVSLYEIPPGQAICPYHYECVEEEWAMALDGPVWVRDPDGVHEVPAMTLVFFPAGEDGAHQLRNEGDRPVQVLMFGENLEPGVTVYPDSDKVGVWPPPNGGEGGLFVRSTKVEYFHGETAPLPQDD